MSDKLKIKMYAFTVDCKEPYELAKFYADLDRKSGKLLVSK